MKRLKSISEFHQFRQLPAPEHPLLSVIKIDMVKRAVGTTAMTWCYDFYCIGLKRVSFSHHINFRYGQQPYDFNEGILRCINLSGQLSCLNLSNNDWKEYEKNTPQVRRFI